MPTLQPFEVRPGEHAAYAEALRRALDGTGPALAPFAGDLPDLPTYAESDLPAHLALAVGTSGSTGIPKRAMLTAEALIASADATHDRLGGPGQWLLPMPAQYIAGTQVLIRSLRAGTTPIGVQHDFADAARQLTGERRYTALVPTQLGRLLATAQSALRSFDAVLLGGAAAGPRLLERAHDARVRVVRTYGMSETAGGAVYDGIPLAGTELNLDADDQIEITGPTVAHGYLADPERTAAAFRFHGGTRTFRTGDLGSIVGGVLRVDGRIDDLINTGGVKVAPRVVEEATERIEYVYEAVALGLPDPEWGQAVSVAVRTSKDWEWSGLRNLLREHLPPYALPRRFLRVDTFPTLGSGKPDRAALAALPGWETVPTSAPEKP
ncbi:O-succinylbenzoic acid--CoA ligase [Branchiibius hedensis]|uniref:O-succinylbenzoic acid--CoA ligase n=1 Tax=Branchiibius hedensis TaxID=672460 RepID=A0A2Y8ZLL0_9MICO|nr:AMP-binding protein [Branchiibius hedensis]PWJ24047.1 O-succinylbenzoic acid--CoA ligase [Branchiibius hedensis]SSA32865.1 O-succinylbenzoic acid--CoA ligase [Branchiibius hedensis]